jgi:ankyrin repeat protein
VKPVLSALLVVLIATNASAQVRKTTDPDGTTPLHWAAHEGDVQAVNTLIRAHADVNARNRYGITPLWLAAANGHALVVDALLHAGASPVTTRGESGESVLMIAAMGGHLPVVERLLLGGAQPNAKDTIRGQTALMWAAAEGHANVVRVLVEAGADINAESSTQLTPLMFAIRAGHIEAATTLLDLGANLTARGSDGTTMLGLAIINAHWELAARLLDRGADANASDVRGRPLHLLALMRRAHNRGLSMWLPRKEDGNIGSLDLVKALLAHGADINFRLDYKAPTYNPDHMALGSPGTTYVGATPLYIAAKNCDIDLLRFLAANGADPNIPNAANVTPLLAAAGVGYTIGESPGTPDEALEAVKLLQRLGNDVKAVTDLKVAGSRNGWDGAGALHGAIIRGATELVKWLIDQGVPLDLKNKAGNIPLDLARGSSLGITYHVQPELAAILERAMTQQGLAFAPHKYGAANPIN